MRQWFVDLISRVRGAMSGAAQGYKEANSIHQMDERRRRYLEWLSWYSGTTYRTSSAATPLIANTQVKELKYNFCRPIVHMAAAWIAGEPLQWKVTLDSEDESQDATGVAREIWDRSNGDAQFMQASISAGILGDMAVVVRMKDEKKAILDFVNPQIAEPEFSPFDHSKLLSLTIRIKLPGGEEFVETWTSDLVTRRIGESEPTTEAYTDFGEVPAVWIMNQGISGDCYGESELSGRLTDLVLEYNHLADKRRSTIDYYANPTPWVKGVAKSQEEFKKNLRTMWFLPENGECGFLEWKGSPPDVQAALDDIRSAISEVSETPAIAFGKIDSGFATATGISLKVLYGPLEAKTKRKKAIWGPQLQRAMWLALKAEGLTDLQPEQVDIIWGNPLPQDVMTEMDEFESKQRLGVSQSQLQREMGYSEEQIKQMADEKRQQESERAAQQAKIFDRGGNLPE